MSNETNNNQDGVMGKEAYQSILDNPNASEEMRELAQAAIDTIFTPRKVTTEQVIEVASFIVGTVLCIAFAVYFYTTGMVMPFEQEYLVWGGYAAVVVGTIAGAIISLVAGWSVIALTIGAVRYALGHRA